MRAFLICYVLGVLALNFKLDDPIFFYLALTAFPVTVYLTVSRSKRNKKPAATQQAGLEKEKQTEIIYDTSLHLNNPPTNQ